MRGVDEKKRKRSHNRHHVGIKNKLACWDFSFFFFFFKFFFCFNCIFIWLSIFFSVLILFGYSIPPLSWTLKKKVRCRFLFCALSVVSKVHQWKVRYSDTHLIYDVFHTIPHFAYMPRMGGSHIVFDHRGEIKCAHFHNLFKSVEYGVR